MTMYEEVDKIMFGGQEADRLYQGSELLWPLNYIQSLMKDNPLLVWMMDDTGGTYDDASGNSRTGTYSGATHGTSGSPIANSGYLIYDGSGDVGSAAVNLGGQSKVTLEFWLWWDAFSNTDKVLFEYTPDYNTSAGFIVNPNSSAAGAFEFGSSQGTGSYRNGAIPRPSGAAWHHYSLVLDRTGLPKAMVDGEVQTITEIANGISVTGNYANSSLFVMARNLSVAPGAGRLAGVALFGGELTEERRLAHYLASA